jgi:hypothetical protein
MIKLSDVKVRPQYRTWMRHRLIVLEYAWAHGPAAAGRHYRISARTIRRWRKRWQSSGVKGVVPFYPRHGPGSCRLRLSSWTYSGPLVLGEDLMEIELGERIEVRRPARSSP